MLVLSRREREAVLIGRDIVITVTRVKGKMVRLAIDAPTSTEIARLNNPRPAAGVARPPGRPLAAQS